jgi:hypothetical protein
MPLNERTASDKSVLNASAMSLEISAFNPIMCDSI